MPVYRAFKENRVGNAAYVGLCGILFGRENFSIKKCPAMVATNINNITKPHANHIAGMSQVIMPPRAVLL